jgi:DNA polymerase-3 subunit epsilon
VRFGYSDFVIERSGRRRSRSYAWCIRLLRSLHLVIAHNAAFDRKFVERRLPDAAGLPWACSCNEVDWVGAGFDGARNLGWLVFQAGLFFGGHRASNDVDAVVALLGHQLPDDRTVLAELVARSFAPSMRVEAVGADFSVRGDLRSRGYGRPSLEW